MKKFVIPAGIRGLIFDCDGTIADTMPLHFQAYKDALGKDAEHFSKEMFYSQAGVPAVTLMAKLKAQCSLDFDPEEVGHRKEKIYGELLKSKGSDPVAPVAAIVREYAGKLPMAVASGGTHENVVYTLKIVGMLHLFPVVVSADEVKSGKPAPDMFVEAARRMQVDPAVCLVFEDGEKGFQAAKAAGMSWVDVRPWYPNGQEELKRLDSRDAASES